MVTRQAGVLSAALVVCAGGAVSLGQGVFDVLPNDQHVAAPWRVSIFDNVIPAEHTHRDGGEVRPDPIDPKRVVLPPGLTRPPRSIDAGKSASSGALLGRNFGATSLFESGSIPPDTMGAVGPDHVVVLINGRFEVYTKDGALLRSETLGNFLRSAGLDNKQVDRPFDPRVLYDPDSGRFFATCVDFRRSADSAAAVLVSDNADPTDPRRWTAFLVDFDTDGQQWVDFPTVGLDNDAFYIAGNMFAVQDAPFRVHYLVVPKSGLLLPSPNVVNATLIEDIDNGDIGFAVQTVVDLDGGFRPTPVIADFNTPAGFLSARNILGTSSPSFGPQQFIDLPPLDRPVAVPQPTFSSVAPPLDTGDTRISGNAVLVDGEIWATQVGTVDGTTAIRWLRIDAMTFGVIETGLLTSPFLNFSYPSIAKTPSGRLVVGCTAVGLTRAASAAAFIGETGPGGTRFGPPVLLRAGTDNYNNAFGGRNRWGDYSATVLDPVDPERVWTFQEFVLQRDVWAVQVTELMPANAPVFSDEIIDIGTVATSDEPIDVSLCGSGFDTEIAIWDALGDLVAVNDNAMSCPAGRSGLFGLTLAGGDYYLGVTGSGAVFDDAYSAQTSLSSSGLIAGDVAETALPVASILPGERQYYRFGVTQVFDPPAATFDLGVVAEAGEIFDILYCDSDFDTELGLWDEDGVLLADNDDTRDNLVCGSGDEEVRRSALLDLQLEDGTYYLSVSGWDSLFAGGFGVSVIGEFSSGTFSGTVNGVRFGKFIDFDEVAFARFRIGDADAPCNVADLGAPFGTLNAVDVNIFVNGFLTGSAVADLAAPAGVFNAVDVNAFVNAFLAGCP